MYILYIQIYIYIYIYMCVCGFLHKRRSKGSRQDYFGCYSQGYFAESWVFGSRVLFSVFFLLEQISAFWGVLSLSLSLESFCLLFA